MPACTLLHFKGTQTCEHDYMPSVARKYRLHHLLWDLGWVDFKYGCSTVCQIMLGQTIIWQLGNMLEHANQGQPNPGLRADGSPVFRRRSVTHQVFPLDALNELLVQLGRQFGGDVERLLNGDPQLVVHLVQQAGVAVLARVPREMMSFLINFTVWFNS